MPMKPEASSFRYGVIHMELYQVLTIAGSAMGAFSASIAAIWIMHRDSYKELKDFQRRLCRIEEKYLQLLEKEILRHKK